MVSVRVLGLSFIPLTIAFGRGAGSPHLFYGIWRVGVLLWCCSRRSSLRSTVRGCSSDRDNTERLGLDAVLSRCQAARGVRRWLADLCRLRVDHLGHRCCTEG